MSNDGRTSSQSPGRSISKPNTNAQSQWAVLKLKKPSNQPADSNCDRTNTNQRKSDGANKLPQQQKRPQSLSAHSPGSHTYGWIPKR